MGDKMGKKDKAKQSKQKDAKKAKTAKKKQELLDEAERDLSLRIVLQIETKGRAHVVTLRAT